MGLNEDGIMQICGVHADYKVGELPPTGYSQWHEWAGVQHRGGLRQVRGPDGKWKFPQELKETTDGN